MPSGNSSGVPTITVAERAAIRWLVAQPEAELGHIDVYALRKYYRRNGPADGWRGRSGRNGAASVMLDRLRGKRLIAGGQITPFGYEAAK